MELEIICNPLTNDPNHKSRILSKFPKLERLDNLSVKPELRELQSHVCSRLSKFLLPFSVFLERIGETLDPLTDHLRKSNRVDLDISREIQKALMHSAANFGISYHEKLEGEKLLIFCESLHQLSEKLKDYLLSSYSKNPESSRMSNEEISQRKYGTSGSFLVRKNETQHQIQFLLLFIDVVEDGRIFDEIIIKSVCPITIRAVYEDYFRQTTIEYSDQNDFSLDVWLKKLILKTQKHSQGQEGARVTEEFVERFNSDPIFAFDTLVDHFSKILDCDAPVESNEGAGLLLDGILSDLSSELAVSRKVDFIRGKIEMIMSGYSIQVTPKTFHASDEDSAPIHFLHHISPEIRAILSRYEKEGFFNSERAKTFFPVFQFNYHYINRLLYILGNRMD